MAQGYQTGAPELKQAAQQMENTNEQLQGNLSSLGNVLSQVEGAWAGQAKKAFDVLMEHFMKDAKQLNQSLQSIAENVSGSADTYTQQEEEASQSLSQLSQTLGGF
ncbi:MAG: WXG100 family type VII secretion target [Nocardioidaceae bacterium]